MLASTVRMSRDTSGLGKGWDTCTMRAEQHPDQALHIVLPIIITRSTELAIADTMGDVRDVVVVLGVTRAVTKVTHGSLQVHERRAQLHASKQSIHGLGLAGSCLTWYVTGISLVRSMSFVS
jgi:hypothetical protein